MPTKTKKNKKKHNKTSKRVLEMRKDPTSVWGKNKPLEKFWNDLATSKYVVVIYKNGKHIYFPLPKSMNMKKVESIYDEFDANPEIEAVLTSGSSQDYYEISLYPKAKDKSVAYVIQHYKKYFKTMNLKRMDGTPFMIKIRFPSL